MSPFHILVVILSILFILSVVYALRYSKYWATMNPFVDKHLLERGMEKPVIWLYYDNSDVNSRQWLDFGARSSRALNFPFLNLCYESIVKQNKNHYRIEVIGGLSGAAELLGGWDNMPPGLRDPISPVNESEINYLRAAIFVEQIGPEYLDLAYGAARAADPKARLVFNEYDVEYDTPEQDQKRLAVLKVLEGMKARGTPVDVLGVQGHLTIGRHKMSDRKFRQFLRDVAQMGLEIQITELDVSDELAPAGIPERDRLIADEYRHFLDVALDEPAVRMVMTWGLSDRHSWIVRHETNEMYWRQDGVDSRPLPFDAALQPKPAWEAIATALANAPKR